MSIRRRYPSDDAEMRRSTGDQRANRARAEVDRAFDEPTEDEAGDSGSGCELSGLSAEAVSGQALRGDTARSGECLQGPRPSDDEKELSPQGRRPGESLG